MRALGLCLGSGRCRCRAGRSSQSTGVMVPVSRSQRRTRYAIEAFGLTASIGHACR
jgi:hypothetical protein